MKHIRELGGSPNLRQTNRTPYLSDNGNYVIDCDFIEIKDPIALERELNIIPGVVENGLFVDMTDAVITLDSNKNLITKVRK